MIRASGFVCACVFMCVCVFYSLETKTEKSSLFRSYLTDSQKRWKQSQTNDDAGVSEMYQLKTALWWEMLHSQQPGLYFEAEETFSPNC